ncbi:diaminopimelate epimerase [Aureibaculum sp. 2210JD6-5]|uniref:diaminopimelate epimerase n=1 Tax=Aureibaculum sp. 2210JD6-5 TaxID=3103957 RepID=UPI002AACDC37|nr:diaminopimelate epimerase [Aureibaculum sp. 2210JD6-5]MDY7393731.1 diaminopimelate epimerase [Aureibaculum sp. 2210JD6-5]
MNQISFYKYQGTGNDFIMIDNRQQIFPKNDTKLIERLCDRKFGIGADGLILLELSKLQDFTMIYYNADGKEGSMCGNGGRCIVAFAKHLTIVNKNTTFDAIDGLHEAKINDDVVSLKMKDVTDIEEFTDYLFLDTGSPHHIAFVEDIDNFDVYNKGKKIRYGSPYLESGTNVNFVEQKNENTFKVRTYERGVEDETLSCGTGVTAVAISAHKSNKTNSTNIFLETLGGVLEVSFDTDNHVYRNVFLKGKATQVFKGQFEI